jgi:hypothetical protein
MCWRKKCECKQEAFHGWSFHGVAGPLSHALPPKTSSNRIEVAPSRIEEVKQASKTEEE